MASPSHAETCTLRISNVAGDIHAVCFGGANYLSECNVLLQLFSPAPIPLSSSSFPHPPQFPCLPRPSRYRTLYLPFLNFRIFSFVCCFFTKLSLICPTLSLVLPAPPFPPPSSLSSPPSPMLLTCGALACYSDNDHQEFYELMKNTVRKQLLCTCCLPPRLEVFSNHDVVLFVNGRQFALYVQPVAVFLPRAVSSQPASFNISFSL